jgi:oligogalacturonide lyase
MAKGSIHPPESKVTADPCTGTTIRQITAHSSIHHHPFFDVPAYDDLMQWLVFVSHRTGSPQLHVEERSSGKLIQLTACADLHEWSIHPTHDGRFVYFTAGRGAWRVRIDTLVEV